MENIEQSCGH